MTLEDLKDMPLDALRKLREQIENLLKEKSCGAPCYYNPYSDYEISHACTKRKGHKGKCE